MAGFFKKGFSDKPARLPKLKFQNRFWLPKAMEPEDAVRVIIVKYADPATGEPPGFYEHNVCIDGGWRYWYVCNKLNGISEQCGLCDLSKSLNGQYYPYYTAALTAIDRSEYETKDGEHRSDEIRLVMPKSDDIGRFASRAAKRNNDLFGTEWSVCRTGNAQASTIGDYWKHEKTWTRDELLAEFGEEKLKGLDYEELFRGLTPEEMEGVVKRVDKIEREKKGKGGKGGAKGAAPATGGAKVGATGGLTKKSPDEQSSAPKAELNKKPVAATTTEAPAEAGEPAADSKIPF